MPEFTPVRTLSDLLTLDGDEISEGYIDGFHGEPEPGNNRSRSYWHGWRNGACDSHRIEKDDAMAALVGDVAPGGVFKAEYLASLRRRAA